MSLFNISLSQSRNYYAIDDWNTGNSRNSISVIPDSLPTQSYPVCTNFFATNSDPCDIRSINDRFASESIIQSSQLNSVSNDNDPFFTTELAIRITENTRAIRLGNETPTNFLYYLPQQNLSSIYIVGQQFYSNDTNILNNDFIGFLPYNYEDKFNSKKIVLLASFDPVASENFEANVLSINNSGIIGFFVESEDTDPNNYGLAWNTPDKRSPVQPFLSTITLSIFKNSSIIVSLIYENIYANNEIVIKHPLINEYLAINLPNFDTEINL